MNKYEQNIILKGYIKRIGITVLCCLPVLVIVGYLLRDLNRVATIAIFTLFMAVAICIEEYIYLKVSTKKGLKKKILHKDEDVFK
ncbi:MAG: hypothetical protein IJA72_00850 [Clostridia bacterium]|nr:hypothetical protein [Clostridia bacterium]